MVLLKKETCGFIDKKATDPPGQENRHDGVSTDALEQKRFKRLFLRRLLRSPCSAIYVPHLCIPDENCVHLVSQYLPLGIFLALDGNLYGRFLELKILPKEVD